MQRWKRGVLACLIGLALVGCYEASPPDFLGVWSGTLITVPVTLDLTESTFAITAELSDQDADTEIMLTGDLTYTADTLTATIEGIAQDGIELDDPAMAAFLTAYEIAEDTQVFTYVVEETTMTLWGDLLSALTGIQDAYLVAELQG